MKLHSRSSAIVSLFIVIRPFSGFEPRQQIRHTSPPPTVPPRHRLCRSPKYSRWSCPAGDGAACQRSSAPCGIEYCGSSRAPTAEVPVMPVPVPHPAPAVTTVQVPLNASGHAQRRHRFLRACACLPDSFRNGAVRRAAWCRIDRGPCSPAAACEDRIATPAAARTGTLRICCGWRAVEPDISMVPVCTPSEPRDGSADQRQAGAAIARDSTRGAATLPLGTA